jgi:predicted ribosomally synthesized peptide with nif11-like leader
VSREAAVAFYERLEEDEALRNLLKDLGARERIEHFVKGELGYDFTLEEMRKVIFERNSELSDQELEAVVGGNDQLLNLVVNLFLSILGAAA